MGNSSPRPRHRHARASSHAMALPMRKAPAMKAGAMKAMKAMKVMKAMKAKKVSKVARGQRMRASVFSGRKEKTYTGLKKSDLTKSKTGKVVSKKACGFIKAWTQACQKARKDLGLKGFVAVKKGSALYKAAKAIYSA